MTKKSSKKIIPLPRQPLTKKARRAILAYAEIKTAHLQTVYAVVDQTLVAEKMRREKLYEWLESKGYRWDGMFWEK